MLGTLLMGESKGGEHGEYGSVCGNIYTQFYRIKGGGGSGRHPPPPTDNF